MFLDEGGDKGLGRQLNIVVTSTTVMTFFVFQRHFSPCTDYSNSKRQKRDHNMQLLLNERVDVHRICLIYKAALPLQVV